MIILQFHGYQKANQFFGFLPLFLQYWKTKNLCFEQNWNYKILNYSELYNYKSHIFAVCLTNYVNNYVLIFYTTFYVSFCKLHEKSGVLDHKDVGGSWYALKRKLGLMKICI